ncbi:serine hydrolase domain-containing protein [Nonomuraea sp. NPDC049637]|uniref:serine hydrolase domain-containing protein n=1 Tax=Nonomuraea sp. NPDC049637 TaxID=3154356 RepID=UPI00344ACF3F
MWPVVVLARADRLAETAEARATALAVNLDLGGFSDRLRDQGSRTLRNLRSLAVASLVWLDSWRSRQSSVIGPDSHWCELIQEENRRPHGRTAMVKTSESSLPAGERVPPEDTAAAGVGEGPVRVALDKAFTRAAAEFGDPGVQAVAMCDGELIWSANSGKAINDPPAPVTGSTMFSFASFGKLILCAYTLRQVESGVLALDNPISAYVGQDVPGSDLVTPRMLLTHTAGYPDLYELPETAPLFEGGDHYDPNEPYTFAMLAKGIFQPVNPGERFEYSNAGFLVLTYVLTRMSGGDEALERDLRHFLRPAGVTNESLTAERSQEAFRRLAHGYSIEKEGVLVDFFTAFGATGIPTDLYGLPFGDGLFAGTALGGAKFLDALFVGKRLLRPDTIEEMIRTSPQAAAQSDTYGMATERAEVSGRVWQGHPGGYGGFGSMGATDLTRGVTLMVVANRMNADTAVEIWKELAEAYASVAP